MQQHQHRLTGDRDYGMQTDTDEPSINSEIEADESIIAIGGVTKEGVGDQAGQPH